MGLDCVQSWELDHYAMRFYTLPNQNPGKKALPQSPFSESLFTDLYQLTMAQSYYQSGQRGRATFSLFFRNFPRNRAYYVFCGLESAVEYLENLAFSEGDLDRLRTLGIFDSDFLEYLSGLSFSGDVRAMREGEVFFEDEPVIEVSGPIIECQLAETFILNRVNLESMLATKAARVVNAAAGRSVVDFAARRTHGLDAGMRQARSSYIAGFAGTSNVAAAAEFGIPAVGTMSHSFISSFESEREAFVSYAESFPDSSTFLVDTYDTLDGVANATEVAKNMELNGHRLGAIRLDSGDLDSLSRSSRELLDGAGLGYVRILASGGLDEYSIAEMVSAGAPIDGFGVGTRVGTSADAPYTDFVYKLVEYDGRPIMKFSEDKVYLPGPKQVSRHIGFDGTMRLDMIYGADEYAPGRGGEPLLLPIMENGKRARALPSLDEIRTFHTRRVAMLPSGLLGPEPRGRYRVRVSEDLVKLGQRTEERIRSGAGD